MGKFSSLEKSSLTKAWSIEERTALAHFLKEKRLTEGEIIFPNQGKDRDLYFVDSGQIKITYENISILLKEGDSFGELSLLQGSSKLVTALAASDASLWVLSLENWEDLRRAVPAVALKLSESINQKLATLLSSVTPPARFFAPSNKAN